MRLQDYITGTKDERVFNAVWHEGIENFKKEFGMDLRVSDDDYEWKYAVADRANDIDELEPGESIDFRGTRDGSEKSRGYIVRIK
jgi:hypothetical protein